ncbi:YadA-like family protein [Caviibacterium pharyngocola]|uniref:Adhesin n=1 Tax=Caviibacterium pharyngocola TaxID=28159 RepID=A0A2M8RVZ1_9PAST|nr:YadA-like family protein [Caviibacterium pharyngocola]PJG83043.1 hypothetical protein CVP04_06710 [Caviibacterium pharyngocola]
MKQLLLSVSIAAALSGGAWATPISMEGIATSPNAVAIGSNSYSTAVDGVAYGQGAVATGDNFDRDDFKQKLDENKAAVDAVNNKQADINNKNNQLDAAKDAIKSLNDQIADLTKQQKDVADKIKKKDELTNQKSNLTNDVNNAQNTFNNAQTELDKILSKGTNLYLNFTDVLNSLNWDVLKDTSKTEQQRVQTVASELQGKIETNFADFAGRYTASQYEGIVQGYINRQASYQGSYEFLAENTGSVAFGLSDLVISNSSVSSWGIFSKDLLNMENKYFLNNKNYLFNQLFFTSPLNETSYIDGYDDISKYMSFKNSSVGINNGDFYLNSWINLSKSISSDKLLQLRLYYADPTKILSSDYQKLLNSNVLIAESRKQLKVDNKIDLFQLLSLEINVQSNINLGSTFVSSYNAAAKKNYSGTEKILYNLKGMKSDTDVVQLHTHDSNIAIITKIKDYTASNQNLITTADIDTFTKYYQVLKDYNAQIDWNFTESAINLTEYRKSLDKVLAYNEKIDQFLKLNQSIIEERKKTDADADKIHRETLQLMNLKAEILDGTNDMTNFMAGIELQYNDEWANYYLFYGKEEADKYIKRINAELKLYDPNDEIVVATTDEAKRIQKAYDDAKADLDKKQKALDDINKQIADLTLTPSETATDETKRAKEQELADREADKARLEEEIKNGKTELDKLKEELAKTDLKELGTRSQAYGSEAFASGIDSLAVGTQATATGDNSIAVGRESSATATDAIAIGRKSTVSNAKSIALGAENTVSGEKSIAIGYGHTVSGDRSTAIGDPNVVSGNDVFVGGNNNTVASNNVMVVGNNVDVGEGFDNAVVLGNNSTVGTANPTASIVLRGTTYNFAGITPSSVVSVGASGSERQITNVAAGRISATSTDAINGSQLHALADAIENLQAQGATTITAGDNITVSGSPTTGYTISATAGTDTNTQATVTAGTGVTVDNTGRNDDGTINYVVSATGTTITAGNNVTVSGNATDGYTINATDTDTNTQATVTAGTGVTVDNTGRNDDGTINYVVSANGTTITAGNNVTVSGNATDGYTINATDTDTNTQATVTAGTGVTVDNTGRNDDGTINYVVSANGTTITAGNNVTVSGNATDGYTINATDTDTNTQATVTAGTGVTVDNTGRNDDGTINYVVSATGTTITAGNNVTVSGNATDGYTINSTDTNTQATVTAGTGVTVDNTGRNDDGTINYVVSATGTTITAGDNVTVSGNATDGYTINAKDTQATVTAGTGVTVDSTGRNDDGTINYVVSATGTKITAGENVTVSGNAIDGYTINAIATTDTNTQSTSSAGKGISLNTTDNDDGTKNYEISAKIGGGLAFDANGNIVNDVKITAGSNIQVTGDATSGYTISATNTDTRNTTSADTTKGITVTEETNDDGTTNYKIAAKVGEGLKFDDNGNIASTVKITAGNDNVTIGGNLTDGFTISAKDTNTQSTTDAGLGVSVTTTDNDDGTKNYTVAAKLGEGLAFDDDGKIANTVKITAGNDNVSVGGNLTDGFTISAKDTNTQSTTDAGKGVSVTATDNDDGTKNYTVAAKLGEGLTFDDENNIASTVKITAGNDNVTVGGNLTDGFTISAKDTNTQSTTDAGKGVSVTTTDNDDGTKNYTVAAKLGEGLAFDDDGKIANTVKITAGNDNVTVGGNLTDGFTISTTDTNTQSTTDAGLGVSVTTTDNDDGTKNYTVAAKLGEGLAFDDDGKIANTVKITAGNENVTVNGNLTDGFEISATDTNTKTAVTGTKGVTVTSTIDDSDTSRSYEVGINAGEGLRINTSGALDVEGVTTATDDGKIVKRRSLNDAVVVTGDNRNISTKTTEGNSVQVVLANDLNVNSVTTGNVSISNNGINAGNRIIANVAPGAINATSTDAVNGSQLHATNLRLDNVEYKLGDFNKRAQKGIAAAAAMGILPQPTLPGKSMLTAATTSYRSEQALAVGYSRLSDNAKHIIKISGSSNMSGKKDVIFGAAYGYQW